MKLRNTSRFDDDLVRWAIDLALEVLVGDPLRMGGVRVWVRNLGRGGTSGHAYGRSRIVASIGPDSGYPLTYTYKAGVPDQHLADAIEGLCSILAHELQHLVQQRAPGRQHDGDEIQCELVARKAVLLCRARRDEVNLIAFKASAEIAAAPPVDRLAAMAAGRAKAAELRLERLRKNVERWEKKLKRAQTALKKLRPKLRASEKRAAARSGA